MGTKPLHNVPQAILPLVAKLLQQLIACHQMQAARPGLATMSAVSPAATADTPMPIPPVPQCRYHPCPNADTTRACIAAFPPGARTAQAWIAQSAQACADCAIQAWLARVCTSSACIALKICMPSHGGSRRIATLASNTRNPPTLVNEAPLSLTVSASSACAMRPGTTRDQQACSWRRTCTCRCIYKGLTLRSPFAVAYPTHRQESRLIAGSPARFWDIAWCVMLAGCVVHMSAKQKLPPCPTHQVFRTTAQLGHADVMLGQSVRSCP